jgi:hypothetical protein
MMYRRLALFKLVDTAKRMISGEIGPIEGSRAVARMRSAVGDDESPVFDPFILIDSESDDIVVGDRSLWAQSFLDEIDRKYAAYEAVLRPGIAADCEALLAVYEPKLRECPACGFSPLENPLYDEVCKPSYELCPRCGFLPGVTEQIEYDLAEWRRRRSGSS